MKILTKVMDLLALSVILSFMILMFSGCQMASGTLSEKEITVFNTEFFNGDITNMNNMLLSSEYSQPDEINLFELFYNGVGGAFGEVSEDELSMLTELCSDAPYLDIIKITTNEMDASLQEKMGISLAETKKTGLDSFYYLEQYDSYYLIMGDSNFDWCMVTSGTWESNNKLILKYEKEYEGGQWVVILQKTDEPEGRLIKFRREREVFYEEKRGSNEKVYCEFFSYLYDLCYGSDFARRGGWPGRYRKGGDT